MTAMWPLSRIPQFDANGNPLVGAKAYFYNQMTLTPQTTYADAGLSIVSTLSGGAILADANGRFPAVYLNPTPGVYRQRVTDANDVVLFDDDQVSVPQAADFVPPDAGSTDPTLLFATGDIKVRHGTGVHSGFVRCAGRTIGSASSGASERANADTSALFQFLWGIDSTLAVSGGRGGTAAGDFAANKTIALPDYRSRSLVGLADMGNTALTILAGNTVDNSETVSTLGATLGVGTHQLTSAQMPSHTHVADALAATTFTIDAKTINLNGTGGGQATYVPGGSTSTASKSPGTPNNQSTGGDGAHPNVQPSALVTFYVKL